MNVAGTSALTGTHQTSGPANATHLIASFSVISTGSAVGERDIARDERVVIRKRMRDHLDAARLQSR